MHNIRSPPARANDGKKNKKKCHTHPPLRSRTHFLSTPGLLRFVSFQPSPTSMASQPPPPMPQDPGRLRAEPHPDLSILDRGPLNPHHLHEHEPDVVALYQQWSLTRPVPPPYNPAASPMTIASALASARNPWAVKAAAAWVLARQLGDHDFELYALSQLIQHCGVALFGPWALIEARCPVGSSILRFANHWVAWNASFSATAIAGSGLVLVSEFTGLHAATLVNQVVRDETHDPRTFALDHWFQPCGDDFAAKCDHDPAVLRAKERERLRPPPPKPSQLGRVDELRMQTRTGPTKGAYWKFKRRVVFSVRDVTYPITLFPFSLAPVDAICSRLTFLLLLSRPCFS